MRFISSKMKDLDICMMSTVDGRDRISTRPMSNNRDVKYNGESFFFSDLKTHKAKDISRNPAVTLSFTGKKGLYIIVEGKARIIRDKAMMAEHWVPELNNWFRNGLNTAGIIMIAVKATELPTGTSIKKEKLRLGKPLDKSSNHSVKTIAYHLIFSVL